MNTPPIIIYLSCIVIVIQTTTQKDMIPHPRDFVNYLRDTTSFGETSVSPIPGSKNKKFEIGDIPTYFEDYKDDLECYLESHGIEYEFLSVPQIGDEVIVAFLALSIENPNCQNYGNWYKGLVAANPLISLFVNFSISCADIQKLPSG